MICAVFHSIFNIFCQPTSSNPHRFGFDRCPAAFPSAPASDVPAEPSLRINAIRNSQNSMDLNFYSFFARAPLRQQTLAPEKILPKLEVSLFASIQENLRATQSSCKPWTDNCCIHSGSLKCKLTETSSSSWKDSLCS